MGERKIIVNKCDVSGCEFYCRYTDNCLDYKHWYDKPLCKNLPDCHYKQLKAKEQECKELKKYLNQIRDEELKHLDIEWDEYETSARQEDYSNIITLVERALGEIDD